MVSPTKGLASWKRRAVVYCLKRAPVNNVCKKKEESIVAERKLISKSFDDDDDVH